jgi:hypothetical protein
MKHLVIEKMPPCGFGNRLIYYYNFRQDAYVRNCDFYCVPWEGYQFFEGSILGRRPSNEDYEVSNFCLGEKFFLDSGITTREIFKLREKPSVPTGTCAVHFRGTDFHAWNPKSILSFKYYYDSINEIKDNVSSFILFTDDNNLDSYKKVKKYLEEQKINFFIGENTSNRKNYIHDFSLMTECDYIISSPSTFCIAAGFIGREKKIIHSKEWISERVEKKDKFWVDLHSGGNLDYKLWKTI